MANSVNGLSKRRVVPTTYFAIPLNVASFVHPYISIFSIPYVPPTTTIFNSQTLYFRISSVLKISAKKQMFWIRASFIITFVAYVQTFWYLAKVNFPRQPMSIIFSTLFTRTKMRITRVFINWPRPTPTTFTFYDMFPIPSYKTFPKSFLGHSWFWHNNVITHLRSVYNG